MNVIGVSFHVGSGCFDASAFADPIACAREAFRVASTHGYAFGLLDIGGGFPGEVTEPLAMPDIAVQVNAALEKHFPREMRVRCIAEPGRYFVGSAASMACNIIAKRKLPTESGGATVCCENELRLISRISVNSIVSDALLHE